jgi:hypothetical protein
VTEVRWGTGEAEGLSPRDAGERPPPLNPANHQRIRGVLWVRFSTMDGVPLQLPWVSP